MGLLAPQLSRIRPEREGRRSAGRAVRRRLGLEHLDLVADPDHRARACPGRGSSRTRPRRPSAGAAPASSVGSLKRSAVSVSVVGMAHRSQPLTTRNVASPMRTRRHPSSAHGRRPVDDEVGPEAGHRDRTLVGPLAGGDQVVQGVERRGRGEVERVAVGEVDAVVGAAELAGSRSGTSGRRGRRGGRGRPSRSLNQACASSPRRQRRPCSWSHTLTSTGGPSTGTSTSSRVASGERELQAAVGPRRRRDEQHPRQLARRHLPLRPVDDQPAAVAGQAPRLDGGGVRVLAAAGLDGKAGKSGQLHTGSVRTTAGDPVQDGRMYEIAEQVRQWLDAGEDVTVAQVVATRGFSSRDPAAAAAWTAVGVRSVRCSRASTPARWPSTGPACTRSCSPTRTRWRPACRAAAGRACSCSRRPSSVPPVWERLVAREPVCIVTDGLGRRRRRGDRPHAGDDPRGARLRRPHPAAVRARPERHRAVRRRPAGAAVVALWPVPTLVVVGDGLIADALADAAALLGWQATRDR